VQPRDPDKCDLFADVVGAESARFVVRDALCHDWLPMLHCETRSSPTRYSGEVRTFRLVWEMIGVSDGHRMVHNTLVDGIFVLYLFMVLDPASLIRALQARLR
jgi:hypothetical protein